jgi:hypothetical protein
VRRLNEIKAGVITSSVGIAVTVFLYVLMKGIILGGDVSSGDAEILSRIWVAGIIPFMVGVGLKQHLSCRTRSTRSSNVGHYTRLTLLNFPLHSLALLRV